MPGKLENENPVSPRSYQLHHFAFTPCIGYITTSLHTFDNSIVFAIIQVLTTRLLHIYLGIKDMIITLVGAGYKNTSLDILS